MNNPATTATAADLDSVRARRAELRESLGLVENALAAPVADRALDWRESLHSAVSALADDFAAHVEITEGPGGLHQAILAGDLRLANAVEALTAEHRAIAAAIAGLLVDTADPTPAAEALRSRGTELLTRLVRHRQRGADLVYEAFATDIGGAG